MEVETAAAVLACGSNAVILKHPKSIATDFQTDQRINVIAVRDRRRINYYGT